MSGAGPRWRMLIDVAAYSLARLALVAVLAGVLFGAARLLGIGGFPLVVALLLAIVLALPLGLVVFAPLRRRATAALAELDQRRRAERTQLQNRLRGEQ